VDDHILLRGEIFKILEKNVHPDKISWSVCSVEKPAKEIVIQTTLKKKILTYCVEHVEPPRIQNPTPSRPRPPPPPRNPTPTPPPPCIQSIIDEPNDHWGHSRYVQTEVCRSVMAELDRSDYHPHIVADSIYSSNVISSLSMFTHSLYFHHIINAHNDEEAAFLDLPIGCLYSNQGTIQIRLA